MLSKIQSATVRGTEALSVLVETNITNGLPTFYVVGLADVTVKEARERIRAAIINSGLEYPKSRITISMSPAAIRKKGSHFDLPMAMGILASSRQIFERDLNNYCFMGEVSLDGTINKCAGVLPMVLAMRNKGIQGAIVPWANRDEAALVKGINIYPVTNLLEIVEHFNLVKEIKPYISKDVKENPKYIDADLDFSDVKGQEYAKRAITVAVAGGHGILMTGSPSTGKTMISERIPSIMPKMNYEEIVETTIVYSVAGLLDEEHPLIHSRPFRQPHHGITPIGLLGGGIYPRPGEVSLATKGVLFMDEVGEFDRGIIDILRIPLEQKRVNIIRKGESYFFPADFLLVAATNPCKCGYFGDAAHQCTCKHKDIIAYQSRISGPILDRIDMHIKLVPIEFDDLEERKSQSSKEMRQLIQRAREIQRKRYHKYGINLNQQLDDHMVEEFCTLDKESRLLISNAYRTMNLNPRTLLKVKKVARTIADLEGANKIAVGHLAEALQYREESIYGKNTENR